MLLCHAQSGQSAQDRVPSGTIEEAQARLQDAESINALTAEGRALYERDSVKRNAYDYCGIAINLAERGEFRESIRAASKALFLGLSEKNEDAVAHAKRDLGMTYLYAGDLERAEKYSREALQHAKHARNRRAVDSVANRIIGDVASKRGELARAVSHYEAAIDLAEGSQRFYTRAALAAAHIAAHRAGNAGSAIESAESYLGVMPSSQQPTARAIMTRLRGNLALAEGRADAAVANFDAALKADGGGLDEAAYERFWLLEGLARARLLMGDREAALRSYLVAVGESERIRARFRSEEIKSGLFGEMQDVFSQAVALLMESGDHRLAWETSERSRSRALLDMMRNRVRFAHGGASHADADGRTAKLQDLSARLGPDTVVIAYHVVEGETYGWAIRRSGVKSQALGIRRGQLAQAVQAYRDALFQSTSAGAPLATRLYDILIKPFAPRKGESIILIPHDSLHYLPFQALYGEGSHLVERGPLSYMPSGGGLLALSERTPASTGKFAAFANPDLGDSTMALPGAQREVEAIVAMIPEVQAYYRQDATRERFWQEAGHSKLLHIAAHGKVDPVDPLYSKLLLAATVDKSGVIEAREVYALRTR